MRFLSFAMSKEIEAKELTTSWNAEARTALVLFRISIDHVDDRCNDAETAQYVAEPRELLQIHVARLRARRPASRRPPKEAEPASFQQVAGASLS